ncbi:MAG: pyruvate formate lyase-activating protein [Mycoplasma sp.]
MSKELKLPYFQTESFGAVDGPGIRFVVFCQGCLYRCLYCHNPESWDLHKKVKEFTVDEIIDRFNRNKTFYASGGITISGGDPVIYIDFLIALAKRCKQEKIHLAVDTSGVSFSKENEKKFKELCAYKPLWIVDVKHINPNKHQKLVGVAEQREIKLLKFLDENNQELWVRQVLVPGYTDDLNDLKNLGKFLATLKGLKSFQLLPYHKMAEVKYQNLGWRYPLKDVAEPSNELIQKATEAIQEGFNIE